MQKTEFDRTAIPPAALILGLAGLIPFVWGTASLFLSAETQLSLAQQVGGRFLGPFVQLAYGQVILAFMSGVLWGFATRAEGAVAASGYAFATLPALWAFFMTGAGPVSASFNLAGGFVAVLLLDWMFWRQELAPRWWMRLRVLLTAIVVVCLVVTGFYA